MKHLLPFIFLTAIFAPAQPKALFYMLDNPGSVKSFADHADKIDVIVSAWYGVDGDGLTSGGPNPHVLEIAAQHHLPVVPIVGASVQADLHKLLTTAAARNAFIASLLRECKKNGYAAFNSTSKT